VFAVDTVLLSPDHIVFTCDCAPNRTVDDVVVTSNLTPHQLSIEDRVLCFQHCTRIWLRYHIVFESVRDSDGYFCGRW